MSLTKRDSPDGCGGLEYHAEWPDGFEEGYEEAFPYCAPTDEDIEEMAREFEQCR
jgi:hypothetical protein